MPVADPALLGDWSAGIPDEWALGCIDLVERPPRAGFPPPAWDQLRRDVNDAIEQGWLIKAAGCGWSGLDVFGVGRHSPHHRLDLQGVLAALDGKLVVEIKRDCAIIHAASGARLVHMRQAVALEPRVLLWELDAQPVVVAPQKVYIERAGRR